MSNDPNATRCFRRGNLCWPGVGANLVTRSASLGDICHFVDRINKIAIIENRRQVASDRSGSHHQDENKNDGMLDDDDGDDDADNGGSGGDDHIPDFAMDDDDDADDLCQASLERMNDGATTTADVASTVVQVHATQ